MFYCDRCAKRNSWPETMARSEGPCEICGRTAMCNDRPAHMLPVPGPLTIEDALKRCTSLTRNIHYSQACIKDDSRDRAELIVYLHEQQGLTLREIARRLNMSSARVAQIRQVLETPEQKAARRKQASSRAARRRSPGRPSPG